MEWVQKQNGGNWSVGVTAIVKVTLSDGSFHEDVGFGVGDAPKKGMAIAKAKKVWLISGNCTNTHQSE